MSESKKNRLGQKYAPPPNQPTGSAMPVRAGCPGPSAGMAARSAPTPCFVSLFTTKLYVSQPLFRRTIGHHNGSGTVVLPLRDTVPAAFWLRKVPKTGAKRHVGQSGTWPSALPNPTFGRTKGGVWQGCLAPRTMPEGIAIHNTLTI